MSVVLNAPSVQAILALDVRPLAGRIGAVVHGLRLSGQLAHDTFAAVHAALLQHKVLFFRGQQHLDDAAHQAFAGR